MLGDGCPAQQSRSATIKFPTITIRVFGPVWGITGHYFVLAHLYYPRWGSRTLEQRIWSQTPSPALPNFNVPCVDVSAQQLYKCLSLKRCPVSGLVTNRSMQCTLSLTVDRFRALRGFGASNIPRALATVTTMPPTVARTEFSGPTIKMLEHFILIRSAPYTVQYFDLTATSLRQTHPRKCMSDRRRIRSRLQ